MWVELSVSHSKLCAIVTMNKFHIVVKWEEHCHYLIMLALNDSTI